MRTLLLSLNMLSSWHHLHYGDGRWCHHVPLLHQDVHVGGVREDSIGSECTVDDIQLARYVPPTCTCWWHGGRRRAPTCSACRENDTVHGWTLTEWLHPCTCSCIGCSGGGSCTQLPPSPHNHLRLERGNETTKTHTYNYTCYSIELQCINTPLHCNTLATMSVLPFWYRIEVWAATAESIFGKSSKDLDS